MTKFPFRPRVKSSAGMTLMEMIIGITMLTVISVPLTSATIMFAQHGTDVDKSLSDDGSIRSISALFVTDAQSARTITVDDDAPCGAEKQALLTLAWSKSGMQYRVSWSVETIDAELTLVRRKCVNGGLSGFQRVATVSDAPAVSCEPDCSDPASVVLTGKAANGAVFSLRGVRRTS